MEHLIYLATPVTIETYLDTAVWIVTMVACYYGNPSGIHGTHILII